MGSKPPWDDRWFTAKTATRAEATPTRLMVDESGKYFIYVFKTATSGTWLSFTHSKRGSYPIETTAQNFDQASHYAFLSDKYVILYSVGSMLYAYDYTRQQLASMDMGAEITCLETEYLSAGSLTDIILATFDEGTGTGTVRKLTIGGGNNNVTIEEKPKEIWPVTIARERHSLEKLRRQYAGNRPFSRK